MTTRENKSLKGEDKESSQVETNPSSIPSSSSVSVASSNSILRRRRLRRQQQQQQQQQPMLKVEDEDESTPSMTSSLLQPMKISVADCLACSGCVTTAETVLVSQHSLDKLQKVIHSATTTTRDTNNNKNITEATVFLFTMSRASFVDLARFLSCFESSSSSSQSTEAPTTTTFQQEEQYHRLFLKLTSFLHYKYKAHIVLDGTIPLEWSLNESAHEFCQRYHLDMNYNNKKTKNSNGKKNKIQNETTISKLVSTIPTTSSTTTSSWRQLNFCYNTRTLLI